jgi:hypothetical protein
MEQDIQSMPAGREMDALVAERVFGATGRMTVYAWHDRAKQTNPIIAFASVPETPWHRDDLHRDFGTFAAADRKRVQSPVHLPYGYSTTIAPAWLVVEKMREAPFSRRDAFVRELQRIVSARVMPWVPTIGGGKWQDLVHLDWTILHVTPEDICRAALSSLPIGGK